MQIFRVQIFFFLVFVLKIMAWFSSKNQYDLKKKNNGKKLYRSILYTPENI